MFFWWCQAQLLTWLHAILSKMNLIKFFFSILKLHLYSKKCCFLLFQNSWITRNLFLVQGGEETNCFKQSDLFFLVLRNLFSLKSCNSMHGFNSDNTAYLSMHMFMYIYRCLWIYFVRKFREFRIFYVNKWNTIASLFIVVINKRTEYSHFINRTFHR